MIFKRFVFIFILMWSAKSNEDGDFFIAKKYDNNNVFCITNSSFALSWIDEEITETLDIASLSTYIPATSKNDIFVFDEKRWLFTNSLQSGISEVILDERWEEMHTEITEESEYNYDKNKFSPVLTISKSEFEIPMSIRTEQEAHIFLCDGKDPSNSECYWFMLQAWLGQRTAIRKCNKEYVPSDKGVYPRKTCRIQRHNITHPDIPKYLFKDKWTHFKLVKKSDTLAFYKFNNNDLTEIIKWTDTEYEKVDVKHMIIHSKFFKGLWKIHNISFIHTNKEFKHIEQGLPIQPDQGLVCISMYVAMCTFCKIKLTLSDGSDILDERTFSAEHAKDLLKHSNDVIWVLEWTYSKRKIEKINSMLNVTARLTREFVHLIGSIRSPHESSETLTMCQNPAWTTPKRSWSMSSGWFKIRFINRNVKSRNEIRLLVSTIGSDAKRYWAIDKVRVCHENEIRYIGVTEEKKCQLVAKDDVISLKMPLSISDNSCPENTIGKFCIPCDWFYKNCKKIKVCEEERCMCSAGYTTDDSDCYYQCSQNSYKGYYGHGCRNKCGHCKWGDYNCDSTDGTCSRGCEDGYTGSTCEKRPSLLFVEAPEIINISYTSAVILVTNFTIEKGVNEEPSFYIVQFKKAWYHDSKWINSDSSQIFNKSSPIKIFDLEADTKYLVRAVISSSSKTYDTEYVRYKEFTTKCEDVTEEQIDIKSSNTTAEVLIRASKYTCKLNKYNIIIKGIGKATSSNGTFLFFEGLKPFTYYTLDLQIGSGLLEKGFQTTEGVPAKIDNVIISHLSDTSIEITWTKPKLRGIFKHYIIEYQHLSFLACNNTNSISSPKSLIVKNTFARVENLMPYTRYSFSVYTANTKLKGPPLTISESTYASNKIKADEVAKIESIVSSHNSVAIILSKLNCDKMQGPLLVKATWRCHSPWCSTSNETQNTFIYNPSSSYIKLENLIPFSNYSLQLKYCRNNTSCSKDVLDTRQFKTNVTVPNKVKDLLVYSKNTNSVSLRWRPPYPPTGHLKDYKVSFREEGDNWYNWDGESNLCKLWPDFYCAKINGLRFRSYYNIRVQAKNQELIDFGYPANVSAYTAIDKSDAPYDLKLVWTLQNDLELEWKHPNVTNGDIQYFEILCSPKDNYWTPKRLAIVNNKYNLTYHYKIDSKEIVPATEYTIRISAYNGMKGEQLIEHDSSPPEIPHLDQDLEAESTNTTITVTMSSRKTGAKTYNNCILLLISDKNCNFKNDMLEMKGFRKVSDCNINKPLVGRFTITIGDDRHLIACSQLANPPLESGTVYNITVLLTNTYKNKSRTNYFSLKYKTQGDPPSQAMNSSPLFGLIIIPILASICGCAVFYYFKRKRKTTQISENLEVETFETTKLYQNTKEEIIKQINSKPITVANFPEYVQLSLQSEQLKDQHETLLGMFDTCYQTLKENLFLDYIDIHYPNGQHISKVYLVSDIPSPSKMAEFWQIVWDENIEYMVLIDTNKRKETKHYWPKENEVLHFRNISVSCTSKYIFENYKYRKFTVTCKHEIRLVNQLCLCSCFDMPHSITFIPFFEELSKISLTSNSPILIHSSDGLLNTGFILLCDICLRTAANDGTVDVLKNLYYLTETNVALTQSHNFYELAHMVIAECLLAKNLIDVNIATSPNNEDLLKYLKYMRDTLWIDQLLRVNKRRSNEHFQIADNENKIIPSFETYITNEKIYLPMGHFNYKLLDNFNCSNRFLTVQQPLPENLLDFWQLVEKMDVSVIVSLNEMITYLSNLFPTENHMTLLLSKETTLHHKSTENLDSYNWATVELQHAGQKQKSIEIFSFTQWPAKNLCPSSVADFVRFCTETYNLTKKSNPLMVMCCDGVTATSLYIAMMHYIEKKKLKIKVIFVSRPEW